MRPDVTLINLETAMTTHDTPWPGKGINYRCHPGWLVLVGVWDAALVNIPINSTTHFQQPTNLNQIHPRQPTCPP
jgi:hypothetical protein